MKAFVQIPTAVPNLLVAASAALFITVLSGCTPPPGERQTTSDNDAHDIAITVKPQPTTTPQAQGERPSEELVAPAAMRSVYTPLAAAACKTVRFESEGNYSEQLCPGYGGVPVIVKSGDIRMDIDAGKPGAFKTLGPFNRTGDQLEWRLNPAGRPIAIIYRLITEDGTRNTGSYLIVERIGTPKKPACWTALVKGSIPDANAVAREKAVLAEQAPCLGDVSI